MFTVQLLTLYYILFKSEICLTCSWSVNGTTLPMFHTEKLIFHSVWEVRSAVDTKPGSLSSCTYNRKPYSEIISWAYTDTRNCGEMYLTQIELKEITLTVTSCLNMFRHMHAQSRTDRALRRMQRDNTSTSPDENNTKLQAQALFCFCFVFFF